VRESAPGAKTRARRADVIFVMRQVHHKRYTRGVLTMLGLGLLAGVLIWAKLRLSTDIPRSAIAEPESPDTDTAPAPPRDD